MTAAKPAPLWLRRKRLRYQSHHRGCKENDLLLGRFAEQHLDRFTEAQLDRYEALLAESDLDIWDWVIGRQPVPPHQDHDVLRLLREFKYAER
jgi:antitoxin CptB